MVRAGRRRSHHGSQGAARPRRPPRPPDGHGTAFQTWCGARVSCHTNLELESVEAHQRTRQQHEREEPLRVAVPPHCQAPIAAQPRQRPFDPPAVATEPQRRLDPTPSDPRGDPTTPQPGTVGGTLVALVRIQLAGPAAPPARRRAHRRDVTDHRLKHGYVREVGGGHRRGQRQPLPLTDQLELGPWLAAIDRICADVVPRAWRARWPSPRWRATSPAGPARRAGRGCRGAEPRTRPPWPTRQGDARRSPASRSPVPRRAAAATGWRCAPCRQSRQSSCEQGWCGVALRRAGGVAAAGGVRRSPTAGRRRADQRE
jgi:hypothetical protein